jgi:hypothetical protein
VVVVGVDDGDVLPTRSLDGGEQRRLAPAEGVEQPVAALVAEVLDHVDEEERVLHGRGR